MRRPRYWFPAKRYGWGWGFPQTWQGWVVLIFFLTGVGAGVILFPAEERPFEFLGWTIFLSAIFVWICYRKGEPPSWRWDE